MTGTRNTGHWKAEDGTRDQSYFQNRLNLSAIQEPCSPSVTLYKRDVRKMAEAAGLHVHAKKDPRDVCFIGERPFRVLSCYLPARPGEIRTLEATRSLASIRLDAYTIGQRRACRLRHQGTAMTPGDHGTWYAAVGRAASNVLLCWRVA